MGYVTESGKAVLQDSGSTVTSSSKMPGWLVLESAMKKATMSGFPSLSPARSRSKRNWARGYLDGFGKGALERAVRRGGKFAIGATWKGIQIP